MFSCDVISDGTVTLSTSNPSGTKRQARATHHMHQGATQLENATAHDDALQEDMDAAPDIVAPVEALQEEADREEIVAGGFSCRA